MGSALFGVANGFSQYYRFAAAEIGDEAYKSRAISWVLAGGLVAAFIGPNTASLTRELIPQALFSASLRRNFYKYNALHSFPGSVPLSAAGSGPGLNHGIKTPLPRQRRYK